MAKSGVVSAMLFGMILMSVSCSMLKPASKMTQTAALGQSAPFDGKLGQGPEYTPNEPIYQGPCVDGQHNVAKCGDCLEHATWPYSLDNGVLRVYCTKCKAGKLVGHGYMMQGYMKVPDLGSAACHEERSYNNHRCIDGEHHVEKCGKCVDMSETLNSDGTTTVICTTCSGSFLNFKQLTLKKGETVSDLGNFGCSPTRHYYGSFYDFQHGVMYAGKCKYLTEIFNNDGTRDITCRKCYAIEVNDKTVTIKQGGNIRDLGDIGCGLPQPEHDYEGPCEDGQHSIDKCGKCSAMRSFVQPNGKSSVECTECPAGNLPTKRAAVLAEGDKLPNLGKFGCDESEDYAGECQDGEHHIESCGSCQAITVETDLNFGVDIQCTQCKPNARKYHIDRGESRRIKDMGAFGCHL